MGRFVWDEKTKKFIDTEASDAAETKQASSTSSRFSYDEKSKKFVDNGLVENNKTPVDNGTAKNSNRSLAATFEEDHILRKIKNNEPAQWRQDMAKSKAKVSQPREYMSIPQNNAERTLMNAAFQMAAEDARMRPGQRDARTLTDLQRTGRTIGKTFTGTEKQWLGNQLAGIDALASNLGGVSTMTPKAQEEYWAPERENTRQAAWEYTNAVADGTDDLRIQNARKALEDAIADDWYLADEYNDSMLDYEDVGSMIADQLNNAASRIAKGDASITADNILDQIRGGNLQESVEKAFENDESFRESYESLINSGAEDLQYAKDVNHLGGFGDLMVDAASSTLSSAQSMLVSRIMLSGAIGKLTDLQNSIVGKLGAAGASKLALDGVGFLGDRIRDILGMTSFGVGAYGGYTNEARQALLDQGLEIGLDEAKKIRQYANKKTNIELATEMLFSSVGAIRNTSGNSIFPGFSDAFGDWFSSWSGTAKGSKILRTIGDKLGGGIEEGLEEVIGDVLDDFLGASKLIGDNEKTTFREGMKDFVVGFMSGMMGEVTSPAYSAASRQQLGNDVLSGNREVNYQQLYEMAQSMAEENPGDFLSRSFGGTNYETQPMVDAFRAVEANGKGATAQNAGRLYEAYQQYADNVERGEDAADKALQKAADGKHLTKADLNRVLQSDTALDAIAEATGQEITGETTNERRDSLRTTLEALASEMQASDRAQYENALETIEKAANGEFELSTPDRLNLAMQENASMEADQILQNLANEMQSQSRAPQLNLNRNNILPSYQRGQTSGTAQNISSVEANLQRRENTVRQNVAQLRDLTENMNLGENGRAFMLKNYNGTQNVTEYANAVDEAYELGRAGGEFSTDNITSTAIPYSVQRAAFNAGREDYLAGGINNGTAETGLRLRAGSERNDGQNTGESAGVLAKGAGRNQSRQAGSFQREIRNARVSSQSISAQTIAGTGLRIVSDSNEPSVAAARKYAQDRGVNFVAWTGGSLTIDGVQSRGFYDPKTNTIYARADHRMFTAEQIAKHETTHAMIHNGVINLGRVDGEEVTADLKTVYNALREELGTDRFEELLDQYVEMYAGTDLSRQDVFEEMICDAVAGMNEFEAHGHFEESLRQKAPLAASKAVTEENAANGTRAGPVGHGSRMSRDTEVPTVDLNGNTELEQLLNNRGEKSRAKVIREYLVSKYAGKTFTMSDGIKAIMDGGDAQKLSQFSGERGARQLGNLDSLIEKAVFDSINYEPDHPKFSLFRYYRVNARYGEETVKLRLNVGLGISDKTYHIYAINAVKEKEADTIGSVGGSPQSTGGSLTDRSASTGKIAETGSSVKQKNSLGKKSIDLTSDALGVDAYKDDAGKIHFEVNGREVKQITAEHVRDSSAIGVLIKEAVANKFISESEAKKQYQAGADLMNMIMSTQDPELTWAFAGATMFSALKKNSDGQYGTTIDFTTVCRKTQEMVTAMSNAMKEAGRGLKKAEVTELQHRVLESGAEVPCPVCYVFSRWAGIGGMLNDIVELQNKYAKFSRSEIIARTNELKQEIIRRGLGTKNKKGQVSVTGTGVTALMKQLESEAADAEAKIEWYEDGKKGAVTEAEYKRLKAELPAMQENIGILSEWTWASQIVTRSDYEAVPTEILFDLDAGEAFASKYPAVWKYRTTRGPSSGKAILPYSSMRSGDIIAGAEPSLATRSLFSDIITSKTNIKGQFTPAQNKVYQQALKRTAAQNLIGGQRYQSTSDFRYEYALDYIQSFWELQALGSKLQTYTKVVEYADIIAAVGGDVNLSVMPLRGGVENGKLIFSNKTGMNIDAALEANRKFDNAQLILVGINDAHILAALDDHHGTGGENIGFVIPYHASGASITDFISELVKNLGERFVNSNYRDYSAVQNDKERSDATAEQKTRAAIRKKILTGKKTSRNKLSDAELDLIRGKSVDISGRSFEDLRDVELRALSGDQAALREYLSWSAGVLQNLYDKMYTGAERGTILNSSQAEHIMPHEYWNTDTTRANAYVNGFIFRSYAYSLGLKPRFSWTVGTGEEAHGDLSGSDGYWKTLIDRPMYNNDGTYREQQRINVTNFDNAMLTPKYAEQAYPNYKIQEPNRGRAAEVGTEYGNSLRGKLSRDLDSDGNQLTEKQAEYFKDSKVRDENGNLLVMYHGTRSYGFTKFRYGARGQASFFTPVLDVASAYAGGDFVQAPDEPMDFETLQEAFGSYDAELQQTDDGSYVVVDEDEENTFNDLKSAQAYLLDRYVSYDFNVSGIYPVYLNIKNPLVIDAEERSWNQIPDYNEVDRAYEYATIYSELDDDRYEIEYAEFGEDPTTKVFSWEELKKEFGPKYAQLLRNGDEIHDVFYDKNGQELKSTTDAWAAWAEQNGYDGVIFKNIYDGGDEASDVYVSFNPEQVKSIYNQNPTENPDIRFSRDLSTSDLYDANVQLRKDLSELRQLLKTRTAQKEYWKGQTKVTQGRQIRQEDVTRLAKDLLKSQNSSADPEAVAAKLKALGEFILNVTEEQADTFYDDVRMKSYEIAHDILADAKILRENGGESFYNDFRDRLKNTPIYVAPSVRNDINSDGWNAIRSMMKGIGTVTADPKKGKTIDAVYHDLQAEFGEWLLPDDNLTEAEQFEQILEVVETYRPLYENLNSYEMAEAVEWTANEILTRIIGDDIRETDPTYADRMEKKLSDQKLKSQEALRKVRENRDRREKALKEHYQEAAQAKRERKIDSAARTRLLHIARRLQNKKLDRVTRSLLNQYIGELDLVAKSITKTKLADLNALQSWYDAYANMMGDDFIRDRAIEKKLERLSKKQINDLTQEEVADLTTVLLNIENEIRTANKLIDSQVRIDRYAAAEQTIEDVNNSVGKNNLFDKMIASETLTPEREIRKITGYYENDPLYTAAKELSDGQRKMLDYQRRAEAKFKKWTQDRQFTRSISGKHAQEITIEGHNPVTGKNEKVKITPAMRMSLYLHEKNEENMRHIANGGVKIPDIKLYKAGKVTEAYDKGTRIMLSRGQVREIVSEMTEKEKAFADAASLYFNGMSRDAINETSEKLKGFSIAGVDYYFPIHTDGSFLNKEFDSIKRDGSLEGMGFLKERIEGATTPIMLFDMNTVLTRGISQHSKYYGLAIPVRNFNKLYRVKMMRNQTSMEEAIKRRWGSTATNYIEKMLTDIQNGTGLKRDIWGNILHWTRGRYAGAVLTTNASVAFKQTASYPTAAAVVGWKPLMAAMKDVSKVDLEKLAEYTPLLWYRMKGYSTAELGDIGSEGGHIPKALNWIQGMDVATTKKLVKAAMFYVNENNKNLTRNTDAWYKEVAKVYNRIIEETQPNYTMMQRPQILRSDSDLTRALNMFRTQPFQNFNILYDAFGNLAAKTQQYKSSGTQDALEQLKAARKNAAKAISSQIVSAFWFSLIQFAWDAFRGKTGKYDDDDEMTFASWLKGMGINMLSSAGGMIPFLGGFLLELGEAMTDAVSKALGGNEIFGQKFYGLSENAASAYNDMGKALISMGSKIAGVFGGNEINESTIRSMADGIMDLAQFAGIPLNNVKNLLQAIARNVFLTTEGQYLGGYKALRVTTDPNKYSGDYYNLLYKAYQQDPKAYQEVLQMMLNDGSGVFTEKKIKDAIETRMKKEQGVSSVNDLEERWLAPAGEKWYNEQYDLLQASDLWNEATNDAKTNAITMLEHIANNMSTGDKTGEALQEDIKEAEAVGLDEQQYILFNLAYSMADTDNSGGVSNKELLGAFDAVGNLSNEQKAFYWKKYSGIKQETIDEAVSGGKSYGLTETEYLLYRIALTMHDDDGNGKAKQSEAEAAIKSMTGLSKDEKAYLFQITNKSWKANPWR